MMQQGWGEADRAEMHTGVGLCELEGRLAMRDGKVESLARHDSQRWDTNGKAQT